MAEQSARIPVADDYLYALGRAIYNFSYLEWGIVWLTETLQPGILHSASTMTAGCIAKKFSRAAKNLDETDPDRIFLKNLASKFSCLVHKRNSLVHGNPHTALNGEQRLLYDGRHGRRDWTINSMEKFSICTATAGIEAGELLNNGRLERYFATKL